MSMSTSIEQKSNHDINQEFFDTGNQKQIFQSSYPSKEKNGFFRGKDSKQIDKFTEEGDLKVSKELSPWNESNHTSNIYFGENCKFLFIIL